MTLMRLALQLTLLSVYGMNIFAFAWHLIEIDRQSDLRVGSSGFFYATWGAYCFLTVLLVMGLYPGA